MSPSLALTWVARKSSACMMMVHHTPNALGWKGTAAVRKNGGGNPRMEIDG